MTVPDFPRKTWRDVPQGTVPDGSVPRVTAADLAARDAALGAARDELNGRLSPASLTGTYATPAAIETATADLTVKGMAEKAPAVEDVIRRAKLGGVLGTSGRPVVAIRIDHQLDPFRSTIAPLLSARYLPFSFGVVTQSIENPTADYEPTTSTWAQLHTDVHHIGGEIWSHSRTHGDGESYESEIVGSKADLEAQGFLVMGWQQPGGPATYGPPHTSAGAMDDLPGRLIRQTYPNAYESSFAATRLWPLPSRGIRGLNHVTLDQMSVADAKVWVDRAIAYGMGVEFMIHPASIGAGAPYMSVAGLSEVLDYIKAKWDADALEVMTPSGMGYADPTTAYRPSVIPDGSFEAAVSGTPPEGWLAPSNHDWIVGTDGGHTGSNYLHFPNTAGVAVHTLDANIVQAMKGGTFLFEGWVRSPDPEGVRWRVSMTAGTTGGNVTMRDLTTAVAVPQSAGWTRVRIPFSIPADASRVNINPGRRFGGAADWDDIRVIAI